MGKNITDQRLEAADGKFIPLIRSENHNETLGPVAAEKILCGRGGRALNYGPDALTFKDVWNELDTVVAYKGFTISSKPPNIKTVVMRYQHAFVGIHEGEHRNLCPVNYSYQTRNTNDPKNLILVVTQDAIHVHCDGVGGQKLMAHMKGRDGKLMSKWFRVDESEFGPGSAQEESVGEKRSSRWAFPDEKTDAQLLGVKGVAARGHRMLIFSIPLKQKIQEPMVNNEGEPFVYRSLGANPEVVKCRAARLSVGDEFGETDVEELDLQVDPTEQIMCTQIDWNVLVTSKGSNEVTISDADAELVAKDLMKSYGACDAICKLSELVPCLHKMQEAHWKQIAATTSVVLKKNSTVDKDEDVATDPYKPNEKALFMFS
jgi:hypothetical protein